MYVLLYIFRFYHVGFFLSIASYRDQMMKFLKTMGTTDFREQIIKQIESEKVFIIERKGKQKNEYYTIFSVQSVRHLFGLTE